MSLKEWKNNEINTKLMKKWGFLKEGQWEGPNYGADPSDSGFGNTHSGESCADVHPEDTAKAGGDSTKGHGDWQKRGGFEEWKAAKKLKEEKNEPADVTKADDELAGEEAGEDLEEGCGGAYREEDDLEEGFFGKSADEEREELANRPEFSAGGPEEGDPGMDPPSAANVDMSATKAAGNWGQQVRGGRKVPKAKGSDISAKNRRAGSSNIGTQRWAENQKISIREAKEITRRIIERIKKENN